jgi:PAS domain S-box-containing protein
VKAEPNSVGVHRSVGHRRTGPTTKTPGGVEVALLDRSGVIASVNAAWREFGSANGGDPGRIGVGVSYLDICATSPGDPFTREVAAAIRSALRGNLPAAVQIALPCHAPDAPRWFDVLISSRFDDDGSCLGAIVTLSPVQPVRDRHSSTVRGPEPLHGPAVPAFYDEQSERLGDVFAQLVLDRAPLGILVVDDNGNVVRAGRAAERLFGHGPGGLTGKPVHHLLPEIDPFEPGHPTNAPAPDSASVTLLVDGVLADGSTAPMEARLGLLPLSRGTGAVVLLRAAVRVGSEHPHDHVVYLDHEIDELALGLDEILRHVFSSGLTVTGAAAARLGDRALSTTLLGVTEELDRAVREIRALSFRLHQYGRRTPSTPSFGPDAASG